MEYFGTNLTEHGHYRWKITGHGMSKLGLRIDDLPFDPEQLTRGMNKGDVAFYQGGGFTAIAISGSPKDNRWCITASVNLKISR